MIDPARNGSEQRLDAIIAELQGVRSALEQLVVSFVPVELAQSEIVELREPEAEARPKAPSRSHGVRARGKADKA